MPSLLFLVTASALATPAAPLAWTLASFRVPPVWILVLPPIVAVAYALFVSVLPGSARDQWAWHAALSGVAAAAAWGALRAASPPALRIEAAFLGWRQRSPDTGWPDWLAEGAVAAALAAGPAALAVGVLALAEPLHPLFRGSTALARTLQAASVAALAMFVPAVLFSRRCGPLPATAWVRTLAAALFFAGALALQALLLSALDGASGGAEIARPPIATWWNHPDLLAGTVSILGAYLFVLARVGSVAAAGSPIRPALGGGLLLLAGATIASTVVEGTARREITRAALWMARSDIGAVRAIGGKTAAAVFDPSDDGADEISFALALRDLERGRTRTAAVRLRAIEETGADALEHQECVEAARSMRAAVESLAVGADASIRLAEALAPAPDLPGTDPSWRALWTVARRARPADRDERLAAELWPPDVRAEGPVSECGALARLAAAARAAGLAPAIVSLSPDDLERVLEAGEPFLAWFVRPEPHALAPLARRVGADADARDALAGRAVVVVGSRKATGSRLLLDYGSARSSAEPTEATAHRIVRGGRGSPAVPRRWLLEMAGPVFETRFADTWRVAAFVVAPERRAALARLLRRSASAVEAETAGWTALYRAQFHAAHGDWGAALRLAREAERRLRRHPGASLFADVAELRLSSASRAAEAAPADPDRSEWRSAVRDRVASPIYAPVRRRLEGALQSGRLGLAAGVEFLAAAEWAAERGDEWSRTLLRPLCDALTRELRVNRAVRERRAALAESEGDWETAARSLAVLRDLAPADGALAIRHARALAASGRTEEAQEAAAAAGFGERLADPAWRFVRGQRLASTNRVAAARAELLAALRADPLGTEAARALAELERHAGRARAAVEAEAWADLVEPRDRRGRPGRSSR